MAKPVRARRLTDAEGQTLQRIVRRGKHDSLRVRRALIVMASASGTTVQTIAGLVQADEDTIREVTHRFNQVGLGYLADNPVRVVAVGRERLRHHKISFQRTRTWRNPAILSGRPSWTASSR